MKNVTNLRKIIQIGLEIHKEHIPQEIELTTEMHIPIFSSLQIKILGIVISMMTEIF